MDITKFDPGTQAIGVTVTGLLVVFIALVGLWVIVALFGKIFLPFHGQKRRLPRKKSLSL